MASPTHNDDVHHGLICVIDMLLLLLWYDVSSKEMLKIKITDLLMPGLLFHLKCQSYYSVATDTKAMVS